MTTETEASLLEALLFDKNISRNKAFERFEEEEAKRIHRMARVIRSLRKELQKPELRYWTEPTDDGRICLHLHQPRIGAMRQVFLTPPQWEVLTHPRWAET